MIDLKEVHFSFLECTLTADWKDKWLEKGIIYLEDKEIGRLRGARYNPKAKQYSTWVCVTGDVDSTDRVEGNFKTCIAFAVGKWMMQSKRIDHFYT